MKKIVDRQMRVRHQLEQAQVAAATQQEFPQSIIPLLFGLGLVALIFTPGFIPNLYSFQHTIGPTIQDFLDGLYFWGLFLALTLSLFGPVSNR